MAEVLGDEIVEAVEELRLQFAEEDGEPEEGAR